MRIVYCIILVAILFSCSRNTNKVEQIKSKEEIAYEDASLFLEVSSEQIHLLSIRESIPFKKTLSVLIDYEVKTDTIIFFDEIKENYFKQIIDSIAIKNNLEKIKVAKLIYSFKYGTY